MPAFGKDGLLTSEQVSTMVDYVSQISSKEDLTTHPGYTIFQNKCSSCHGMDAKGGREFGAPNLTDDIWLYGSDKAALRKTLYYGRSGVMPYWKGRLDDNTLRQLTVYIHSLGGGEESNPISEPVNVPPAGSSIPSQE
jgi:cytochrome c oxidase cbb3-type subunit 3